jgi:hypothetical protein
MEQATEWLFPTTHERASPCASKGIVNYLRVAFGLEHRPWLSSIQAYGKP